MADSPSVARSLFSKLLFVVGVLVLLGLLAWGILKIVPKIVSAIGGAGSSVSSLFGGASSLDLTVTPKTVKTGSPASVEWNFAKATDSGSYSLSYECGSGATLSLERASYAAKAMTCGTGYTLGGDSGFATVTPKLNVGESLADVTLRVAYRDQSKDVASATSILTVTDGTGYAAPGDGKTSASEGTVTSTKTTSTGSSSTTGGGYVTGGTSAHTGGLANLQVSNVQTDGGDGVYFDVRNTGGRATGLWSFSYNTPTSPSDTFNSPDMISLNPGEGLRLHLRFAEVDRGTFNVTVRVDPYNQLSETNEGDNSFGVTVTGSGSSNGGSNNNNNNNNGNSGPNLSLYSFEIGRESGSTFTEDDSISHTQDAAVRFKIRNDGDESTGKWRYEIDLPGTSNDYRSSLQSSLDPDQTKTITYNLGRLDADSYKIKVIVDSDDDVSETDESDNTDSATLDVN